MPAVGPETAKGAVMGVHDGHRARKKKQFLAHGLDAFADHEALELLLFFTRAQGNVNPTAHALLERFGSLEAVFSAPAEELMQVSGVGENTAVLLRLVPALCRRAESASDREDVIFNTTEDAAQHFLKLFRFVRDEEMYEACLDAKGKLLSCQRVAEGSVDAVSINIRRIVERALYAGATGVVLSHNHPSGVALPSGDDNAMTLMVYDALRSVGIELLDHIIVADRDCVSLRQNGLIPPI